MTNPPSGPPPGARESRAIAGVSMGGYGALNLGTKRVGLGGARPFGDTLTIDASPALAVAGGPAPMREVVVYRPPAFFNTDRNFPILYFLGGHGQIPTTTSAWASCSTS